MYQNADIILATKHRKEAAISLPFAEILQAQIIVPEGFDTDQFGTFSGEIERIGSAYETVIKKAQRASSLYGYDYAIASEGSFGPHPTFHFVPGGVELMSFIDTKHHLQVVETLITTDTNYSHIDIRQDSFYSDFLRHVKFGSHGIMISSLDDKTVLAKGVTKISELESILVNAFKKYSLIRLEADMRAMMNPTRMNVIRELALKLANRLKCLCEQCHTPGFGASSSRGKLLCSFCLTETHLYKYQVLKCVKCDFEKITPREDGLRFADQQHCPFCNP